MSKKSSVVLTKTIINAMQKGDELWDDVPQWRGLHVRAGARGKAFLFAYTSPVTGKVRRAGFGVINLEAAQKKAWAWKTMVSEGKDPLDEQDREKQKGRAPTLKDLEVRWEEEAVKSEKHWAATAAQRSQFEKISLGKKRRSFSFMKPKTIKKYRSHWKQLLDVMGGEKKLSTVTLADVAELHRDLSIKKPRDKGGPKLGGPVTANRVVNFMSALMQSAIIWGLVDKSMKAEFEVIFETVDRNQEYRKIRSISTEEMQKFFAGLERLRNPENKHPQAQKEDTVRADLIELMIYQGTRISEFMTAKLSWIDWSGATKVIKLPDTKTGARVMELSDAAVMILKRRCEEWHAGGEKSEEDWVLMSPKKRGEPLKYPYRGWHGFLKASGLPNDIDPHTIRHTVMTNSVQKVGLSLEQAAAIAGHKNTNTTAGYVHRVEGAVAKNLNRINKAMKETPSAAREDDDDILPDYIKKDRSLIKLQNAEPLSASTH